MGKKDLLREPLLHFLLIGAVLFAVFSWRGGPAVAPGGSAGTPAAEIVVTRDDVEQITTQFERTWQRPPTAAEREALVEDFVRSEIYYREAVGIGLDRDDEVLKRRLRQKMEFILEDITALAEPTEQELLTFMSEHREKYVADPQIAFRQVFVSVEKRGTGAEAEALRILTQLAAGTDPGTAGDATLLAAELPLSPLREVRAQFGEELARSLLELAPGRWAGPFRSPFGLHLLLVRERVAGRLPDLGEVREAVTQDWMVARQQELKDAAYARLRQRYTVTVEEPAPPQGAAGAGEPAR